MDPIPALRSIDRLTIFRVVTQGFYEMLATE